MPPVLLSMAGVWGSGVAFGLEAPLPSFFEAAVHNGNPLSHDFRPGNVQRFCRFIQLPDRFVV